MQGESIFLGSPQWNYAQFRLQLILSHPNVQILSIEKNPAVQGFVQAKQTFFKLDAAIDVTEDTEGELNYYKTNAKKGSIFRCGRIDQECKFQDGLGNPKTYRMLLFKIAVKNLLPIYQSASLTKEDLYTYTEQYDSVYLTSRKQQMSVYDHQYFLKSVSQYIWQFDITYRYVNANEPTSKVKKWNPQAYKCQQCLNNAAYWYCVEENQLFCQQCYEEIHKRKYRNAHRKEQLTPFNCHKKCQKAAHNQSLLQFYCLNCKALKCSKCLTDQNHNQSKYHSSKVEPASRSSSSIGVKRGLHEFIPVRELIQMYQEKEKETISELKEKLIEKIKQVESVITVKQKRYNEKLKRLEDDLAQAMARLKQQSRREINEAVAIHVELKRKFDEALWIQKFILYNEDVLEAESNIKLKDMYASYMSLMNAQEYFRRMDQKIGVMRGQLE